MDPMYDCTVPIGVDPRSIANRILDVSALSGSRAGLRQLFRDCIVTSYADTTAHI